MIELNSPTASIDHMEVRPVELIEITINSKAPIAKKEIKKV